MGKTYRRDDFRHPKKDKSWSKNKRQKDFASDGPRKQRRFKHLVENDDWE